MFDRIPNCTLTLEAQYRILEAQDYIEHRLSKEDAGTVHQTESIISQEMYKLGKDFAVLAYKEMKFRIVTSEHTARVSLRVGDVRPDTHFIVRRGYTSIGKPEDE